MMEIDLEPCMHENINNPLLKIISKELSMPVTAMLSKLQILNNSCIHNKLTYDTFSVSEGSIKTLSELIDHVDFLSAMDDKEENCMVNWFLVKSLVNSILQELRSKYTNVINIVVKISLPNSFVFMEEKLLRRVLYNLLSNSLKFSLGGRIELFIVRVKGGLAITIRDSGIGIPRKEIPQVFKPFIRGSNAGYKPGWGLGLAVVVKSLVKLGGCIEVNSERNPGSEFKVFVPCKISHEIIYNNFYS